MKKFNLSTIMIYFCSVLIIKSDAMGGAFDLKCNADFGKIVADQIYRDYPANVSPKYSPHVPPNLKTGRARRYREVIGEESKGPPNFAGQFKLVRIGCGAATICVAIVDDLDGHVYFPRMLNSAEALLVDTGSVRLDTLNFRLDSNLLILIGVPNENRRMVIAHPVACRG